MKQSPAVEKSRPTFVLIFGPSATLHSANKRCSHTFRSMGSHFRSLLPFSLSIRSTFSLSLTLHLSLSLCCKRLPDLSHALQLSLSLTFSFSPTFLFRKIHLPTTTSFGECDSQRYDTAHLCTSTWSYNDRLLSTASTTLSKNDNKSLSSSSS